MAPPGPEGSFADLLEVIIARAGGVTELSRVTKVSARTLSRWRRGAHPSSRVSGGVEEVNRWARDNVPDYPPAGYHPSGLLGYVRNTEAPPGTDSSEVAGTDSEAGNSGDLGPAPRPAPPTARTRARPLTIVAGLVLLVLVVAGLAAFFFVSRSSPATRVVTVQNKIATGTLDLLEDRSPSYLSSAPRARCVQQGCKVPGTDLQSDAQLTATCRTLGDTITNADRTSPGIDTNPGAVSSDVWVHAVDAAGADGFISIVYLVPGDRHPDELPLC